MSNKDAFLKKRDLLFVSDVNAALVSERSVYGHLVLLILIGFLVAAFFWARAAEIDEVVRGSGKVIPISKEQVIQSLEGGILSALHVTEGDIVEKGQVLLNIDDTISNAVLKEEEQKSFALNAAVIRLRAELEGKKPSFDKALIRSAPEVVEQEKALYTSRRRQLDSKLASLKRSLTLARSELSMTEPLVKQGLVSEIEFLRLRREENQLKSEVDERRNQYYSEVTAELTAKQNELLALKEIIVARKDTVNRSTIYSPMRGTIKNIQITTLGGVIQPGIAIMEIVPADESLLVEAKIRPSDIAFLSPGQPVTVKVTAYDFSIYGGLKGELVHISPDTFQDKQQPENVYYAVQIKTNNSRLIGKNGENLTIIPGMVTEVDIKTGKKSVLDYVLKPLLKAQQRALRER